MQKCSVLYETARKTADITYDTLPPAVARRAAYAVVDAVTNCLASREATDFTKPLVAMAQQADLPETDKGFTLFGQTQRGTKSDAVFFNVAAGSVTARNDHHTGANVHPGSVVIPALLAECEQLPRTGKDFLAAVVVGYEVMIRMGRLLQKGTSYPLSDSLRPAMLPAPMGVALAVAHLDGVDAETTKNAAALACHHYCGVEQWRLAGTAEDNYQNAWDTVNGMHCVRLARAGVRAADENLDGCYGFLHIFGAENSAGEMVEGLGEHYAIEEVRSKVSGACARVLTPLQLAEEYLHDADFSLDRLERLSIYVNQKCTTRKWFMNRTIVNQSDAINSVAYAVAAVLAGGSVDRIRWFPPYDETTLRLTESIELLYDDQVTAHLEPDGIRIEAVMQDGSILVKEKRTYEPLDAAGIERKFLATAVPLYGPKKAEHLLQQMLSLEEIPDMGALVREFRLG